MIAFLKNYLRDLDVTIRSFLSTDREAGEAGTIARTPEEMKAWHEADDPKPTYAEFVGLREEDR